MRSQSWVTTGLIITKVKCRSNKKIIRDKIKDIRGRSPYIVSQTTGYEDKVVKNQLSWNLYGHRHEYDVWNQKDVTRDAVPATAVTL